MLMVFRPQPKPVLMFLLARLTGKFLFQIVIYHMKAGVSHDSLYLQGAPQIKSYYQSIGLLMNGKMVEGESTTKTYTASVIYQTDSTCFGISSNFQRIDGLSGHITLSKFDSVNKIVSQLFDCVIATQVCDTLHVTDGRFWH